MNAADPQPQTQPQQPAPAMQQPTFQQPQVNAQQIKQLAATGRSAKEIAGFLGIDEQTVAGILNDEPEF
jgi:DNA-binding NarL/FixJ family response regulator